MEKHLHFLGWEVKDKVSGFVGIVTTIGIDLYGCIQAIVAPKAVVEESGKQVVDDARWFDVTRLVKVGNAPIMEPVAPRIENPPGGYAKPVR